MKRPYICIENAILLDSLGVHWTGAIPEDIEDLIFEGELQSYLEYKRIRNDDNSIVSLCRPNEITPGLIKSRSVGPGRYPIVFKIEDIEHIEQKHSEFKLKLMEPRYQDYDPAKDPLLIAHGKIKNLEEQNAILNEKLNAASSSEMSKPPRTANATEAASQMRVKTWKQYSILMVKVALECAKEGPKARKRPDLAKICKRLGCKLSEEAMDVLREALPPEHVSRRPGPS